MINKGFKAHFEWCPMGYLGKHPQRSIYGHLGGFSGHS